MKKESHSSKKKKLINLHSMKSKQAFIMLIVMLVQIFTPIMKVEAVTHANTGRSNFINTIFKKGDMITNDSTLSRTWLSYNGANAGGIYKDEIFYFNSNGYYVVYDVSRNSSASTVFYTDLYQITLNTNGSSDSDSTMLVKKGDKYEKLVPTTYESYATGVGLPTPTRDSYSFGGWYTEAEDGTQVTNDTTFNGTNNTTLYAHWTFTGASYTVNDNLTYNGEEQTGITLNNSTITAGTDKATNVGDYTATVIPNEGYTWEDNTTEPKEVTWSISPAEVTIPTLSNTAKSFTDSEQSPTITGYDENTMTQTGTASAKDAGNYTITWNLKDSNNYKWNDDTITEKNANWSIGTVDIPDSMIKFEDNEVTYDGDEHSIKITGNLPGGTIEYSTDGVNYSETLPTFTDVGEYAIYYRASKSNYNDKVGSNTLKINPKALTEYTIIIENQVYTGEEIKPTIIIKDGDRIVPSTEYELEFEDNIGPGTGKVIVKNKDGGNYIISTKNATFMIIDPGKVEFIDPTTPNSNNAKVIESADEVIAKIDFTDEDLDKINQGKNIDVYLEVKDISNSISSSDKSKIEEKLGNDKLGLYLDVSLFKKVEGEEATKITETKTPITISFEIPDELINKDSNVERTFKVLRLHDGNVEEIEVKVNGNIATFETDKFSTYALTYNDVITTSNPHTGDNIGTSFVMLIISSLGLISILGYTVISNKRKLVKTNN
ncbi:MAG: InlB B-repeat-containing protein [Bacilli bacterium]|nr:InlB B-repeat-containing protein [Bacilli bacterium]